MHPQGLSSILAALQLLLAGSKRLLQASSLGLHQHRLLDYHSYYSSCLHGLHVRCESTPEQQSAHHCQEQTRLHMVHVALEFV